MPPLIHATGPVEAHKRSACPPDYLDHPLGELRARAETEALGHLAGVRPAQSHFAEWAKDRSKMDSQAALLIHNSRSDALLRRAPLSPTLSAWLRAGEENAVQSARLR